MKKKAQQPVSADAAALMASTYRNIKEPCPECGATQIQATAGDGRKTYWCANIQCAYIKPKGKGVQR